MSDSKNITFFTSESVCAGHPDKICDGISDAIVDAILAQDTNARTGVETVAGANQICLFGEINTTAKIDFESIAWSLFWLSMSLKKPAITAEIAAITAMIAESFIMS